MEIKEYSIAFVLTRYQYNILLATLDKLQIDHSLVILFIAEKAYKQGVRGEDFYKSILYNDYESIKTWAGLKEKIYSWLDDLGFYSKNIFLRNFNATISRVLMSYYSEATVYLLEEGMPSYMRSNFMGCPKTIKEKIKTLLTRVYFSKGLLRFLPINRKKTVKVGLFNTVKPWLKIPYIPIKLNQIKLGNRVDLTENIYSNIDILIIDQPLWQIGLKSEQVKETYAQIFSYLVEKRSKKDKIAIKMHPSSNKQELEVLLTELGYKNIINIINTKENIEELLFSDKLKSVKVFAGFFSWALCLLQTHRQNDDVEVIACSNNILENKVGEVYGIMRDMGIVIYYEKGKEIIL